MGVFARLLLQSSEIFLSIFNSAQSSNNRSALEAFIELWLERFDNIPTLAARKCSALALCRLLTLPHSWIIQQQLSDIVAYITSVWFEANFRSSNLSLLLPESCFAQRNWFLL